MDSIVSLQYKLHMFGVTISGPASVLCNNQSIENSIFKLEYLLNGKHSSIVYHAVRWLVSLFIMRVGEVYIDKNIADEMTKQLTFEERNHIFGNWKY